MAMPTGVGNKEKSLMEHLAAAKSALATAEMHGQVLAATFPDTSRFWIEKARRKRQNKNRF